MAHPDAGRPVKHLSRLAPFLVGCGLVFVGARVAPAGAWQVALDGLGLATLGLALVMRSLALRGTEGALRWGEGALLAATALGCVAVGLHFASGDAVWDELLPDGGQTRERIQVVLRVAWPLLLALALGPLVTLERSLAPQRAAGGAEPLRLRAALATGLEVPLALALLLSVGWLTSRHDLVVDLSYYHTARAGESTRSRVGAMAEPVEVLLFFPEANEVAEQVRGYLGPIERLGAGLRVRRVERLLEPDLARRVDARAEGTLVLLRGERSERIYLGTALAVAKARLRKLDRDMHRALVRLDGPERVAYLLAGHGERGSAGDDEQGLGRLRGLQELLRMHGYTTRRLGLAEGLGEAVPSDAALVVALGPRQPLLPAARRALAEWFQRGGRTLLALDPEAGQAHPSLLEPLGLRFDPTLLAADSGYLRRSYTPADRRNLVASAYEAHPVTAALRQAERSTGFIALGSGHLQRLPSRPSQLRVRPLVRTPPRVWLDTDANLRASPGELRRPWNLVAAAELERGGEPGRALVFADMDAVGDTALANPGNALLLSSGLRWLAGEEELQGGFEAGTDSPVLHSRQSDRLWFYGTIFGPPLIVLALGFGLRRRRRA